MKKHTPYFNQSQTDETPENYLRNYEDDGGYPILKALKEIIYPWMKEAAAEAYREQAVSEKPRYPERVGVTQASEITGYSVNSLYQLHSRGQIPGAHKVGGKLLFETDILRKWVMDGGRIV